MEGSFLGRRVEDIEARGIVDEEGLARNRVSGKQRIRTLEAHSISIFGLPSLK